MASLQYQSTPIRWLCYKQLLDEVFVISRIIKLKVGVISQSRRLRLITLTETLIILDITKIESNNNIVLLYIQRKKKWSLSSNIFSMSCLVNEANLEVIFLLLHGWQTTQSA